MNSLQTNAIEKCSQFLALLLQEGVISAEQHRTLRASMTRDVSGTQRLIGEINGLGGVSSREVARIFGGLFSMPVYPYGIEQNEKLLRVDEMMVMTERGAVFFENPIDQRAWTHAADVCQALDMPVETMKERKGIISRDERQALVKQGINVVLGKPATGKDPTRGQLHHRKVVNALIEEALSLEATDIHIDPDADGASLRHRVAGELRSVRSISLDDVDGIASALHEAYEGGAEAYMQRPTEVWMAHAGQPGESSEVKINTVMVKSPDMSRAAPKMTLHLIRSKVDTARLSSIGLPTLPQNNVAAAMRSALSLRSGLVLVAGPAGSGATSTVASMMAELQRLYPLRSRMVIEPGNELAMAGVNHIAVGEQKGFAPMIRAVKRHEPDEIIVGQLSSGEIAAETMELVSSGQFVLSTIQAPSAIDAIVRLRHLGIASDLIASGLRAVLSQRLVRKVCRSCGATETWGNLAKGQGAHFQNDESGLVRDRYRTAVAAFKGAAFFPTRDEETLAIVQAGDCSTCGGSGYLGRQIVCEMLLLTEAVRTLVAEGASAAAIKAAAKEDGFEDMWCHGLQLVRQRHTTLDELFEVLGSPPVQSARKSIAESTQVAGTQPA